tara:strand:+ start:1301 stop:2950 length:1650 start_codon:yes stop_codon:yes gene_type:complete
MLETLFFGVITFIIVLGPLVILHELGHLWTARGFGVKTLEFGFGFPPRVGGFWTGQTTILVDESTLFEIDSRSLEGKTATIKTLFDDHGRLLAVNVRHRQKGDDSEASSGAQIVTGKVRSFDGKKIVVADMLWSFNWLPLGGFVRMVGEESSQADGSLGSKPYWQRIVVMGSGALVNALIPFVLLPVVLMIPSEKTVGDVVIVQVFPGSPADEAGIRPGDKVIKVDGRKIENIAGLQQAVTVKLGAESTWEIEPGIPNIFARPAEPQYQYAGKIEKVNLVPRWKPPSKKVVATSSNLDNEILLANARVYDARVGLNTKITVVETAVDTLTQISKEKAALLNPPASLGDVLQVVDVAVEAGKHISLVDARLHDNGLGIKTDVQEGATGVQISIENGQLVNKGLNLFNAFPIGWRHALDTVVLTRNALTTSIIGSSNPQFAGPSTVGPIGIGQLTGEIAVADAGLSSKIITFATLAATLSLSLAILNILPIPALDGGRIFFVFVEIARRGKRISPDREGLVHLIGFALLIGIIALISVEDVTRIIRGESFF